jgi:Terpene synthase family 2, C-terminal metal binding
MVTDDRRPPARAGAPGDQAGHQEQPGTFGGYLRFRLPAFPRFTPALHRPGADRLEARCQAWLAGHMRCAFESEEALDRFLEHRTTLWNLLVYASAHEDRIDLICHWIDVLFTIDDAFAHTPPRRLEQLGIHRLPALIAGQPVDADTPYTRVFRLLREQSLTQVPPGVWERCAHTLKGFFDACRIERDLAQNLASVDLATYEKYRKKSIGACCFPLAEFGLSIDLTAALEKFPELGRLNMLVARHWIGVNDIFSYRKELYAGDTVNEIELALNGNGGDLQAAVDRIAATVTKVENEFDLLCGRLLAGPAGQDVDIRCYLEALGWMIAGNLEWSYITPRYNGHGHTWNGETDATVILTPQRTLYLPADAVPASAADPVRVTPPQRPPHDQSDCGDRGE